MVKSVRPVFSPQVKMRTVFIPHDKMTPTEADINLEMRQAVSRANSAGTKVKKQLLALFPHLESLERHLRSDKCSDFLKRAIREQIDRGQAHMDKLIAQERAVKREFDRFCFLADQVRERVTRHRLLVLKNQVAHFNHQVQAFEVLGRPGFWYLRA